MYCSVGSTGQNNAGQGSAGQGSTGQGSSGIIIDTSCHYLLEQELSTNTTWASLREHRLQCKG